MPTWVSTRSRSTTMPSWTASRLAAYKTFRVEAEQKGFRHFLEVFAPNACACHCPQDIPRFVNDNIVRTLAGVTNRGRPLFLKIPYLGPAAMEALAGYDRSLIVGILGGSAGTSYDAFHMLWEAKKYGARVALFGRKINNAEHQLTFVQLPACDRRRPDRSGRGGPRLSRGPRASEDCPPPFPAGRPAADQRGAELRCCGQVRWAIG